MSAEFAVCRSQVEEWTKLASIPFRLLGHDEQERRLDLISTVGAHSFFIICPAIHSDGKWVGDCLATLYSKRSKVNDAVCLLH